MASDSDNSKLTNKRSWLFRLAAIAFGLALLTLVELTLRIVGVGQYADPAIPTVGFSEIRPLFVKNDSGDRYEIPKYRQVFFQPESFAAKKSRDEFRVFCLGGSTVQGRPYSIETSFTTWLELNLRAAEPDRTWEVVNCGGVSYASYRLVPILKEALAYEPDMFIVYTGHNEFLEERTYGSIKSRSRWTQMVFDSVGDLRIAGLLRSMMPAEMKPEKVDLPGEVDALLDYRGGMEKYHRDSVWADGVVYEYEQNLRRMIWLANNANVPILFVNPVSNVRDCPPFKVEVNPSFNQQEIAQFEERWEFAKECSWDDLSQKRKAVEAVLELDEHFADAQFLLANVNQAALALEEARAAYYRAKDNDVCPLRMLESMDDVLRHVTKTTNTALIDTRSMFESKAELGLPGDRQMIDHVHPRIDGHQLIADELFRVLEQRGVVTSTHGWEDRRKEFYQANYDSLPENYFPESVERLRGLKLWAEGRVTRLRPKDWHTETEKVPSNPQGSDK